MRSARLLELVPPRGRRPGADAAACPLIWGIPTPGDTYWYFSAAPELLALAAERLENHPGSDRDERPRPDPAGVLHRPADPASATPARHTIAAYRDTFRLLLPLRRAADGQHPVAARIADLDAPLVSAFLDHLETVRGNSVRTRNARLAAIHSLFRYAALRHPEDAAVIQRVLAIRRHSGWA